MKKVLFMTPFNRTYKSFAPEFSPSKTVPDDAMTIQQILDRVSRGLTTGLDGAVGVGDDVEDDDLETDWDDPTLDPEFDKLDALELTHGYEAQETRRKGKELERSVRKKKEKEAFDKAVDDEISRRSKKQEAATE